MARYQVTLTMRPPSWIERLWYRSLGIRPPLACCAPKHREAWVRLLPQAWTRIHERYARTNGFFWLPCVLCSRPYGGHQSGGRIPDPEYGPGSGRSIGICPRCTRRGRHIELGDEDCPTI